MAYTIVITKKAKRDIEALEAVVRNRLGKKLLEVSGHDDIRPFVRQLADSRIGTYRLRVGDYRILLDLDGKTLVLLRVQHRKEAYR